MATIELRSASDTDSEFCYQLHKAAMGAYVTAIWGWDEQAQRDFHARVFNPDRWKIITNGGEDIGMVLDVLAVNERAHALYRRLGMTEVDRHGDNDIKIAMRYRQPTG